MIEGSDINDGESLAKTRMETAPNGAIKFHVTLPSGRSISSEWIAAEKRKEALMLWVDKVREQIAEDVSAITAEKRAKARAALQAAPAPVVEHPAPAPATSRGTMIEDPCTHAKNQVALLEAEVSHWNCELVIATKHLGTAKAKLAKWKQIVASFEDTTGEANDDSAHEQR